MQGLASVFFVLMALVLLLTYVAIRREWFAPGKIAGAGVVVSILLMIMISLGQGNSALQAIIVGIIVGGLFSGVTVGIAWYFHSQEMQKRYASEGYQEPYYDYEQSDETV
jgi:ABC-type Fe3+-siderophore transport system permease subunit